MPAQLLLCRPLKALEGISAFSTRLLCDTHKSATNLEKS